MRLISLIISAFVVSACSFSNNPHQPPEPVPEEMSVSSDEDTQAPRSSEMSIPESARIDPGIVILPDTSVDAVIRTITPPEDVDPAMVIPGVQDTTSSLDNDR